MRLTAFLFAALFVSAAQAAEPACTTLQAQMAKAPAGPVFLASYPTATIVPLQANAFLYDNATAAIALVGCGDAKDAARIGDAIVFALNNDPVWHDGRLRNAYQAGVAGAPPAKIAGWWDNKQNRWAEDPSQVGSDSGNLAWAMLALLALYRANHDVRYRESALAVARYVEKAYDAHPPAGFMGGTFGDHPSPLVNHWKSTEHNTDLAAAFVQLAAATRDAHWRRESARATSFVAAMWNRKCRCFAAGTAEDFVTRNNTLALDAQLWPSLSIPGGARRYAQVWDTARARIGVGNGFAYGEAKGGIWTEGTAQAALLMKLLGHKAEAADLLKTVEKNRVPEGAYFATDVAALPTGFDDDSDVAQGRAYFRLPHLAALAWVALGQTGFNPFTGSKSLPH
jgi:hypothetical protein